MVSYMENQLQLNFSMMKAEAGAWPVKQSGLVFLSYTVAVLSQKTQTTTKRRLPAICQARKPIFPKMGVSLMFEDSENTGKFAG